MNCVTEMYLHYFMTAQDLYNQVEEETDKLYKLELLTEATENLNRAEKHGAPKETLRELRILITNKYIKLCEG